MQQNPCLARLLSPLDAAQFLAENWPGRALTVHGDLSRLPELSQLAALQSAGSALAACSGAVVTAMLPDRRDESNSVQVTPDVALKLHQSGMNLSIGRAERFLPELSLWLEAIKLDLGLPRSTWGRCIIYLSPPNAGAPLHFDANVNFSLQLRGRKTWTLAKNDSVRFPTQRFVMGFETPSAELQAQAHGEFPQRLPDHAERVELLPGSLLFVPRGQWHATTSQEETLSLNFVFGEPTWAILLGHALVERLHRHEAWRKTPSVRACDAHEGEPALADAQGLLEHLRGELARLSPEALRDAALPEAPSYRRAAGAHLRRNGGGLSLELADQRRISIASDDDFTPVLEQIFERGGWFQRRDLGFTPTRAASEVELLLRRLADEGLLECSDE